MAKQKCPECPEGAPDWLVSYGDMTTLLLCFFVFLLVTAKVDVDKLSAASGYMAHKMGLLPENRSNKMKKDRQEAKTDINGKSQQVLSIDEGKKLVVGGKEMFKKGDAAPQLTSELMERLLAFARQIRGLRNIVEVRGHTGTNEISGSLFRDEMDLSVERARAIRDFLIKDGNIRKERIRVIGCADHERLKSNLFFSTEEQNRRVEIRVTAKYQDFNPNTSIK